jgi:hypothetical protein
MDSDQLNSSSNASSPVNRRVGNRSVECLRPRIKTGDQVAGHQASMSMVRVGCQWSLAGGQIPRLQSVNRSSSTTADRRHPNSTSRTSLRAPPSGRQPRAMKATGMASASAETSGTLSNGTAFRLVAITPPPAADR